MMTRFCVGYLLTVGTLVIIMFSLAAGLNLVHGWTNHIFLLGCGSFAIYFWEKGFRFWVRSLERK